MLEVVAASGIDPAEFSWEEIASRNMHGARASVLRHVPSRFYFCFDNGRYIFSPGRESVVDSSGTNFLGALHFTLPHWLEYLQREIAARRPWEGLSAQLATVKAVESASPTNNTPFTEDEKKLAREGLAHVKRDVRAEITAKVQLSPDQMVRLEARFDDLDAKVDRLGRFDWKDAGSARLSQSPWRTAFLSSRTSDFDSSRVSCARARPPPYPTPTWCRESAPNSESEAT